MRFSTIILSAFLAALSVKAQNATTTSAAVSGTTPLTPAQSSEAACLNTCAPDDNTCRTKCIPIGSSTNGISNCIAACPKGNGTAADNDAYLKCVFNCQTALPASASASPTATGTAAGSGATGGTVAAGTGATTAGGAAATGTGTSTATGSSASATKSSAAENLHMGASLVGAAGLFAALFAL